MSRKAENTTKKSEVTCPGCEEPYVDFPSEELIQCDHCKEWWHEECTGYEADNSFKSFVSAHSLHTSVVRTCFILSRLYFTLFSGNLSVFYTLEQTLYLTIAIRLKGDNHVLTFTTA